MYQSSLGTLEIHNRPRFEYLTIAKVTNTSKLITEGYIEAAFDNGGALPPIKLIEQGIAIAISTGDYIIVGFVNGNKTEPYCLGVIKGKYAAKELIKITKGEIHLNGKVKVGQTIADLEAKIKNLEQRIQALEAR